ncbi:MAG: hypothetical protein ABJD11_14035 [Gemmatimonadota bacterium]
MADAHRRFRIAAGFPPAGTPMSGVRAGLGLVLILALAAACGRPRQPELPAPSDSLSSTQPDSLADSTANTRPSEVVIVVSNHHWLDMRIFLVRGGVSRRLGTAVSEGEARFTVPTAQLGPNNEIRLRAHAIGGNAAVETDRLVLHGGDEVAWSIEGQIALSSVLVY